jgi:hypothetical protein
VTCVRVFAGSLTNVVAALLSARRTIACGVPGEALSTPSTATPPPASAAAPARAGTSSPCARARASTTSRTRARTGRGLLGATARHCKPGCREDDGQRPRRVVQTAHRRAAGQALAQVHPQLQRPRTIGLAVDERRRQPLALPTRLDPRIALQEALAPLSQTAVDLRITSQTTGRDQSGGRSFGAAAVAHHIDTRSRGVAAAPSRMRERDGLPIAPCRTLAARPERTSWAPPRRRLRSWGRVCVAEGDSNRRAPLEARAAPGQRSRGHAC